MGAVFEYGVRIMPNANYYREQARLLARWSLTTTNRDVCERLLKRAHQLAMEAEKAEASLAGQADRADEPRA